MPLLLLTTVVWGRNTSSMFYIQWCQFTTRSVSLVCLSVNLSVGQSSLFVCICLPTLNRERSTRTLFLIPPEFNGLLFISSGLGAVWRLIPLQNHTPWQPAEAQLSRHRPPNPAHGFALRLSHSTLGMAAVPAPPAPHRYAWSWGWGWEGVGLAGGKRKHRGAGAALGMEERRGVRFSDCPLCAIAIRGVEGAMLALQ